MSLTHPHFVPSDAAGDRQRTAVLLVGTAEEAGLDQRGIATTHTGFYVNDEVADALAKDGIEVRRDTNPYATTNALLADRRLDINSDAVGATAEAGEGLDGRVVRTVDGPLADTRLDIHSDARGVSLPDLDDLDDEDDDLDDDLDDEDEDSEEDDDSDDEDADEDDEDDEEGTYDPAEVAGGGMKDAQAFVTENPEQAEAILAAEEAGKNRPKQVAWLNEFIENRDAAPADDSL